MERTNVVLPDVLVLLLLLLLVGRPVSALLVLAGLPAPLTQIGLSADVDKNWLRRVT